MRGHRPLAAVIALVAGVVAGCGSTSDRESVQPAAARILAVWEAALAAAPENALVPVVGVDLVLDTLGDPSVYATPPGLRGGIVELAPGADLPAPEMPDGRPTVGAAAAARTAWQQPDASEAAGTSVLGNPRWESRQMLTAAGPVDVPVWQFDVRRSSVTVTAVAVDRRYLITPRGMPEPAVMTTARLIGDRTVEFQFPGAPSLCSIEYETHAVEGSRAVAVAVETIRHFTLGSCNSSVEYRTLTVELGAPLGDRVVVGPDGRAMYVPAAG